MRILVSCLVWLALCVPAFAQSLEDLAKQLPAGGFNDRAEVVSAARSVCLRQTQSETLVVDAYHRCVKATVKTAYQKLDANSALAKNDTVAAR